MLVTDRQIAVCGDHTGHFTRLAGSVAHCMCTCMCHVPQRHPKPRPYVCLQLGGSLFRQHGSLTQPTNRCRLLTQLHSADRLAVRRSRCRKAYQGT
eukprot:3812602-Prymnesium_polylepis.2